MSLDDKGDIFIVSFEASKCFLLDYLTMLQITGNTQNPQSTVKLMGRSRGKKLLNNKYTACSSVTLVRQNHIYLHININLCIDTERDLDKIYTKLMTFL